MNIVSLTGVSKTLIGAPLFKDVSLGIEDNDRIGLIGRNGAGKSTFLRILAGTLEVDEGSLARRRDLRVHILPQSPQAEPGWTLQDFLLAGEAPVLHLLRQYLAALHSGTAAAELDALSLRMEQEGGFLLEQSFASLCSEFGLPGLDSCMDGMSGGMIKKAGICRALAGRPDLVLLDEPTNHLDIDAVELLEKKLSGAAFAFLLVTHDRVFLESVCNKIIEIDRSSIFSYPGNYSHYLEMRRERWNALEKADKRREAILKIELKWLNRGARARATKSERRKRIIRTMQDSALERPEEMGELSSVSRRLGKKILAAKGLSKSFGDMKLFEPFSYEFDRNDRIGIVGPNGCGKTTLLRLLCGLLEPSSGELERGINTCMAYYGQTADDLPQDMRMLDYIRLQADRIRLGNGVELDPERLLERFLFDGSMQQQKLYTLSGGEKRRLQLVSVLASGPNVLVLDEPTNDLDIDTIELLEAYIEDFDGVVLIVSHDRAFLDSVCNTVLAFGSDKRIALFPGNYSEYRQALADEEAAKAAIPASGKAAVSGAGKADSASADFSKTGGSASGKTRKPSWAEKKEYEGILDEIEALEKEKIELESFFASGNVAAAELDKASRRYAELQAQIDQKTRRWEELAGLIDG